MRRVLIAVVVAALAVASVGWLLVRHYTGTSYIEHRLARALGRSTGYLYRLRIGSAAVGGDGRSIRLEHVTIDPDSLELETRARSGRLPRMRSTFSARSLSLEGVDLWALARGDLRARSAVVDSPRVAVRFHASAAAPAGARRAKLPHEELAAMRREFRIDTLRVLHGEARYSEMAKDGVRPGTIRFEDVTLTATHIANRPDSGATSVPAVAEIHLLLAGAAPSDLRLSYDLLSPELRLDYEGTVGAMDASALNEILVDLMGYRITEGRLDGAKFHFSVDPSVSTGEVEVRYHDLKIEVVDKATRTQGLSEVLQSAINNKFKLRHDNPSDAGSPALTVPVHRPRAPQESFFRMLWANIRYGVVTTLGS